MENNRAQYVWALLRILMGWTFLWSFFDKLLGLGFSTLPGKSWIAGGSPTYSLLKLTSYGPLGHFYQSLVGNAFVEWLFMGGLFFIGITLMSGILVKIGSYVGILMLIILHTAMFVSIVPKENPFITTQVVYIVIMISFTIVGVGQKLGLGEWWSKKKLVKKYPILE